MLEQLRRNSRSWLIWFIFAIIILAFVLFFGPQSGPEMFGCAGSSAVVEVQGEPVSVHSWRFAMNGRGFGSSGGSGPQAGARRAAAIDFLVERELLAQEAEKAGFLISTTCNEDDIESDPGCVVQRALARGDVYITGLRVDGTRIYFNDGYFDAETLERYAGQLGLASIDRFVEEQKREMLANITREMLLSSVWVSDEEARSAYIHGNTTIRADYLLFEVSDYAEKLQLTEAMAQKWLEANPEAAKAEWEKEKAQFASAKERVQVRQILLPKEGEDAKEKAQKIRGRLAGGEDFAKVAAEVSTDERTKHRGGLLGWRNAAALGYGTAVVEAVKKLKPGELSEVIESPRGLHILKLEERTSEPLTYDQRKLDIAFKLAATSYARQLAKRDAEAALAKVPEGGKLEDVFERAKEPDMPALPEGLTPEQRRMLEERMREQIQKSLENKPDEPAGDTQPDQPEPDKPKEGSESGRIYRLGPIQLAQAGGSTNDEPAAEPAPPAPPAGDLPAIEIDPPGLESIGPAPRPVDTLAGLGRGKELVTALFETLSEGQVAGQVFEVSEPDGFVVVQLLDRSEADLDKFDAAEMRERLLLPRQIRVLTDWIKSRCEAAAKAGEIGVNTDYLVYDDDKPPMPYSACANISEETVFDQIRTRRPSAFGLF